MADAILAGECWPAGPSDGRGDGTGCMLCIGDRIGPWLQFIGDCIGCIPGDLIPASPGDATE